MAGTAEIFGRLGRRSDVSYTALVTGLEAAPVSSVEEIAVFGAASESSSPARTSTAQRPGAWIFAAVAARALASGLRMRGSVSCVLGCPYEGHVSPEAVADVAQALAESRAGRRLNALPGPKYEVSYAVAFADYDGTHLERRLLFRFQN